VVVAPDVEAGVSHEFPKKVKGVYCPYCNGTRFRSRGRYRPLVNVRIVYAECARCAAYLTLKTVLVSARPGESSPSVG
jgi:hypothetical protein